jgi:aspartyl protease family protein
MISVAMISLLGLLTYLFQGAIDAQYNPNQRIQSNQRADNTLEIMLKRNRSGHYVATGRINGEQSVFLLDTGATYVAVPEQDAARLGLKKGQAIQLSTANGMSMGYRTIINELTIGEIRLSKVKAVITPKLNDILLGMSALKQVEFTQRGDQLFIRQSF